MPGAKMEIRVEMNMDFFFSILNALNVGDVMNEAAYAILPYRLISSNLIDPSHRPFSCALPFRLIHYQSTIQMLALPE
jgi:hypothetical protein